MDSQSPGNEIIKLIVVADMDNFWGIGCEDLTNSAVKVDRLLHALADHSYVIHALQFKLGIRVLLGFCRHDVYPFQN